MKIIKFIKENIFLGFLVFWAALNLFIAVRMNIFSYNNFDFGKFDLGNMTQMVWNTLHGRLLYLTDYFGANLPRWAMSHVDPILLLFVPVFALYQHPLTLVFAQLLLVLSSSLIIYKIAELRLESKFTAMLLGLAFLFYPALGYLNTRTGFHGVTAVIPFFLTAFYLFEKMYTEQNFSAKRIAFFWVFLILAMSGKEEIPLYIFMYSLFILFYRNKVPTGFELKLRWFKDYLTTKVGKVALSMATVSLVWFAAAFFVIIPFYARMRAESYKQFAGLLSIDTQNATNVTLDNYFLSRYPALGETYSGIVINTIFHPDTAVSIIFGGQRIKNLQRTFTPLLYLPLVYPPLLMISVPDFLINYLTSSDGVGTAEIENHRISMIVPVLFMATVYAIGFLKDLFEKKKLSKAVMLILSIGVLAVSIKTTYDYNNPVYLWLNQALSKKLSVLHVFAAKFDRAAILKSNPKIGDVVKVADLSDKDIDCANKVVQDIPKDASVSGPDYLGAHLSMRETYAVFPALYNSADYVIVDVFSRKILTILDLNPGLVREVVFNLLKDPNYELQMGCANLFVYKKVGPHGKTDLLPVQEKFSYQEKMHYEIFNGVYVVDYSIPSKTERGSVQTARFVYTKGTGPSLNSYLLYMSYLNIQTGELYQAVNLPSFSISEPDEWNSGYYYIEDVDIALPKYLTSGKYMVFIGMSNKIRTRNLYIGDMEVY